MAVIKQMVSNGVADDGGWYHDVIHQSIHANQWLSSLRRIVLTHYQCSTLLGSTSGCWRRTEDGCRAWPTSCPSDQILSIHNSIVSSLIIVRSSQIIVGRRSDKNNNKARGLRLCLGQGQRLQHFRFVVAMAMVSKLVTAVLAGRGQLSW